MGPPSRYAFLLASQTQTQTQNEVTPAQPIATPQVQPIRHRAPPSVDTSFMSNVEWAKHHLTQLTTASNAEEFATRGCAFLSRHANITMNGMHVSPALYAEQWGAATGLKGTISFTGAVETPHIRIPMTQNAGLVGLLYDAIFVLSEAEHNTTHLGSSLGRIAVSSSVNLIIADDKNVSENILDKRRVVSVNQVLIDKDDVLMFPLHT